MIDPERAAIVASQFYGKVLNRLIADSWSQEDIKKHWNRPRVLPALYKFLTEDGPHSFELREEAMRFSIDRLDAVFARQQNFLSTQYLSNGQNAAEATNKENLQLCSQAIDLKSLLHRTTTNLQELVDMMNMKDPSIASSPNHTRNIKPPKRG